MPKRSTPSDFWARGEQKLNGCILWTKAKQIDGYGILRYQRKFYLAHRLSYILTFGEIPPNMCVCHTCDTPACINPDHLFIGTHTDNMHDMRDKNRRKNINMKEKNGRAKITQLQANEIRVLYANGTFKQVELAPMFNLTQATISLITRNKCWIE